MTPWTLAVPFAPAMALNANDRPHWSVKARRVVHWRGMACVLAKGAPRFDRAKVTVTFSWPDKRRRDVHNWAPTAKALMDGLTDAGLWVDDDDAHVIGPDLRRGYGPLGILIEVEAVA